MLTRLSLAIGWLLGSAFLAFTARAETDDSEPIRYRSSRIADRQGRLFQDGRASWGEPDRDASLDVALWGGKEPFWSAIGAPEVIDGKWGWAQIERRDYELHLLQLRLLTEAADRPAPLRDELRLKEQELLQLLQQHLGPERLNRLHQLAWRHACDRHTLFQMLTIGVLGEELGVTDDQREELTLLAITEIERLRVEHLDLEYELFEKVCELLDEPRRKQLKQRFGDRDLWRHMPLLDFARIEEALQLTRIHQETVAEVFPEPRSIRDEAKFNRGNPVPVFDPRNDLKELQDLIQIDSEQRERIAQRRSEIGLAVMNLRERLRQTRESASRQDNNDDRNDRRNDATQEVEADRIREMQDELNRLRESYRQVGRDALVGPQRIELERIEELQKLRYFGVTNLLVCGSLGYEIDILPEQIEAIVSASVELHRHVVRRRAEILELHHQNLIDLLEPRQRRQLIQTLGEPVDSIKGVEPRVYLATLASSVEVLPKLWTDVDFRPNQLDRPQERTRLQVPQLNRR